MSRKFSEDLKYLNQRLGLGVEWVQRPVVYRSPTPLAEHNESPPGETKSYDDVVQAHEKFIRKHPGDNLPIKTGNERHYRMVSKESLGVVNAPQDVQRISNSETPTRRTQALDQTFHPTLLQRASSTQRSVDLGSTPSPNINAGHKLPRQRRTTNRVAKPQAQAQAQKCQFRTSVGNHPLRRSERIAAFERTSKLRVNDSHQYEAFRSLQGNVDKRKQRTLDPAENAVDCYDSEVSKAADKKKPRPQRGLNILQKVSFGGLQLFSGMDAAGPQSSPDRVTPRRSKQLKPPVPSLAKDLTRTASTDRSKLAVRSKLERKVAGNLTARTSAKPRGISKRQPAKTTRGAGNE